MYYIELQIFFQFSMLFVDTYINFYIIESFYHLFCVVLYN